MKKDEAARLITLIENNSQEAKRILKKLSKKISIPVIGITGPPGSGKSTIIDRLIYEYRKRGKRIGILAVDPSSRITGGAFLGDRLRMQSHALDKDVFIRSFATRGVLGGISKAVSGAIRVLAAMKKDIAIVETIGSGQDEIEVSKIADIVVLVITPDAIDDIQFLKAGIVEIADIVVVNKSDLAKNIDIDGIKTLLNVPVLTLSAKKKKGVTTLIKIIDRRLCSQN